MYPRPFHYVRAESVEHAVQVLAENGDAASVLAGGASLIPLMKYRQRNPRLLVDIADLRSDLGFLRTEAGHLRVGALVRHADAEREDTAAAQPLVREVAQVIGDTQVRNMGTIVGGLCAVEPTGDWVPCLLALRGRLVAQSTRGEREIPADELVVGPYRSCLSHDELVTEARFPCTVDRSAAAHEKLSVRVNAGAVSCSAALVVDDDGVIEAAGVAFGALERQPVRAVAAEELLTGHRPTPEVLEEAGRAAVEGAESYTDARGSAEFRRAAAAVLLRRAVRTAYDRATQKVAA